MPSKKEKLKIKLNSWDHTCADGCCFSEGIGVFLNGKYLIDINHNDIEGALRVVLEKLGYEIEIEESYE